MLSAWIQRPPPPPLSPVLVAVATFLAKTEERIETLPVPAALRTKTAPPMESEELEVAAEFKICTSSRVSGVSTDLIAPPTMSPVPSTSPTLPSSVRPLMTTSLLPSVAISKMWNAWTPVMVSAPVPGPVIVRPSVIVGRSDARTIESARPGAKSIVSLPAAAFASMIAWRSEPAPLSLVLRTVNVAAPAGAARRAAANAPAPAPSARTDPLVTNAVAVRGNVRGRRAL